MRLATRHVDLLCDRLLVWTPVVFVLLQQTCEASIVIRVVVGSYLPCLLLLSQHLVLHFGLSAYKVAWSTSYIHGRVDGGHRLLLLQRET